jgi:uncharacterized protein
MTPITTFGIIGAATLLALAPFRPAQYLSSTDPTLPAGPPQHVIVVNGQGFVEATPDEATISLGVETIRPAAQEAQAQSNTAMDKIVRQILALGISRDKIRTTAVSLIPQRKSDTTDIAGYAAVDRITVTVDDLSLVGRVIDAGVAAGANTIDSLAFGVRNPETYQDRALRLAMNNAKATADAIAAEAGVSSIRLVHVEAIGESVAPRMSVAAPAAAAVLPGTLSVNASVQAMYAF